MRGREGTYENSDEASESESPRMAQMPAVASEGQRRIHASLARRLTQELIDREMVRADPRLAQKESTTLSSESVGPAEPPIRYPGAMGLPPGGDDSDSDIVPSEEQRRLRLELLDSHRDSFSAPTSPTNSTSRQQRLGSKVGSVLGLSTAGLRRETARVKQGISDRLSLEFESYANYVNQSIKIHRRSSALPAGGGAAAAPDAAANSMLLTSADIPLEMILGDPVHRKTFRMLAESLFCAESLLFWERVNDFKALCAKEPAVATALAKNIYKNFLDPAAEKQLLVREALREQVREGLQQSEAPCGVFDAVQLEAYSTMQFSLYPEYLSYLNASRLGRSPTARPKENRSSPARSSHHDVTPSLRDCLTKREFAEPFLAFAGTLLCGENIEFWQRVNAYQTVLDPEEQHVQAMSIWDDFLSPSSPTELNVGSKTRKAIRYELENQLVTASTFNEAQRDVLKLISLDVYPKFCNEGGQTDHK